MIDDQYVQEMIAWHFDPRTGSKFWLDRLDRLPFDPRRDIRTVADLRRFPDLSGELKDVDVRDLVPAAYEGSVFEVFESGGSTGAPKRVIDRDWRTSNVLWVSDTLRAAGFPDTGGWLYAGPNGPHVVGRSVKRMAHERGQMCFTMDFDPRWVKRVIRQGKPEVAKDYLQHIVEQLGFVLESQDVSVLFVTPPVLEAAVDQPRLMELLREKIRAVLWAGTAMNEEDLRVYQDEVLPDAVFRSIYGNTIMGIACQRDPVESDEFACVYETFEPASHADVLDDAGERAADGELGSVLIHLVSRELLIPNVVERDTAVRVPPVEEGGRHGLAGVGTRTETADGEVVEGVY